MHRMQFCDHDVVDAQCCPWLSGLHSRIVGLKGSCSRDYQGFTVPQVVSEVPHAVASYGAVRVHGWQSYGLPELQG